MDNLVWGLGGVYYSKSGVSFGEALGEAIGFARARFQIQFEHSDVQVTVAPDSDPNLLARDWQRARDGYLGDTLIVGPYPKVRLSEEERASDQAILEAMTRLRQLQYEAAQRYQA